MRFILLKRDYAPARVGLYRVKQCPGTRGCDSIGMSNMNMTQRLDTTPQTI